MKDVLYKVAGQLTQMQTDDETGPTITKLNYTYTYSATQNNGRITQQTDALSGEQVSYQYDSLNRLTSAVTTGPEWGMTFGYNKLSHTQIKGNTPPFSMNVDGLTNRIASAGFTYDLNGNLTATPSLGTLTYDVDNRLTTASGDSYAYGPDNKRVYKKYGTTQEVHFYGAAGERLGVYRAKRSAFNEFDFLEKSQEWLYFAGRRLEVTDRLGSVKFPGTRYFPYGEESVPQANNQDKFGTYYRDATGLDYADQRYYASTLGRFLTSDPYRASAGPGDPRSWNKYSYTRGDPVNFVDPEGLRDAGPVGCDASVSYEICVALGMIPGAPGDANAGDGGGGGGSGNSICYDDAFLGGVNPACLVAFVGGGAAASKPSRTPRLVVKDDCYWETGTGFISGYARVITYQVVDQLGKPFYGSEVPTVKETITPTGGVKISGNGVWKRSDNSMSPNGVFVDFYSSNGQGTGKVDQVYYVGGVALHVDIGQGNPTALHNTYSNSGVVVNGTTSPRPCKEGDPVAR